MHFNQATTVEVTKLMAEGTTIDDADDLPDTPFAMCSYPPMLSYVVQGK